MARINWRAVIAGTALAMILALAGFFMARPGVFIDIPEDNAKALTPADVVVVTPNGTKYHREDCASLNNSKEITTMTLQDAETEGYEPCMRCRPRQ